SFFLSSHVAYPDLPSFPTRRSSDLYRWGPDRRRCGPRQDAHFHSATRVLRPVWKGFHFGAGPHPRVGDVVLTHLAGSPAGDVEEDRKSTRLNSSHVAISYAVFCLKK